MIRKRAVSHRFVTYGPFVEANLIGLWCRELLLTQPGFQTSFLCAAQVNTIANLILGACERSLRGCDFVSAEEVCDLPGPVGAAETAGCAYQICSSECCELCTNFTPIILDVLPRNILRISAAKFSRKKCSGVLISYLPRDGEVKGAGFKSRIAEERQSAQGICAILRIHRLFAGLLQLVEESLVPVSRCNVQRCIGYCWIDAGRIGEVAGCDCLSLGNSIRIIAQISDEDKQLGTEFALAGVSFG